MKVSDIDFIRVYLHLSNGIYLIFSVLNSVYSSRVISGLIVCFDENELLAGEKMRKDSGENR